MDGCALMDLYENKHPFTAIIKLGRVRTFFRIIRRKKNLIYTKDGLRMSKSWANFDFCMSHPFNTLIDFAKTL